MLRPRRVTGAGPPRRTPLLAAVLVLLTGLCLAGAGASPGAGIASAQPSHGADVSRQGRSLAQTRWAVNVSAVPALVSPTERLVVYVTGTNPPVSQMSWTATAGGVPAALTASTVRAPRRGPHCAWAQHPTLYHTKQATHSLHANRPGQVATWTLFTGSSFRAGIAAMPGFLAPGVAYTFYLNYIVPGTSAGDQLASFSVQVRAKGRSAAAISEPGSPQRSQSSRALRLKPPPHPPQTCSAPRLVTGRDAVAPSVFPLSDSAFTATFTLSAGAWTDPYGESLQYMFAYSSIGQDVRSLVAHAPESNHG